MTLRAERRLSFEGTRALGLALAGHPLDAIRVAAGVRRAAEVSEMTFLRTELGVAEGWRNVSWAISQRSPSSASWRPSPPG